MTVSLRSNATSPALPPLVEPGPVLTRELVELYSRNVMLPELGDLGQRRLSRARVLVVGAGGLGSPVLLYLAAAGVGTLGIIDDDRVEMSNLQRQVVHGTCDVGRLKVESARDAIAAANPFTRVEVHPFRLTAQNAVELFEQYDLIVDGADNFATRYLVSDAAALLGKPCVWGSILRFGGQASVFWEPYGPTYRDLYPDTPLVGSAPTCGESGALGALCGAVGAVMAAEAVKLVTGIGRTLLGRLLTFDALDCRWHEVGIVKDPRAAPITALTDDDLLCGAPLAPERTAHAAEISPEELRQALRAREQGARDFDLIDVREPGEHSLVSIPGARLLPLGDLRSDPLLAGAPRDREVVLHCKHGPRSREASALLTAAGFVTVRTLTGGIIAWVAEVEPHKPCY